MCVCVDRKTGGGLSQHTRPLANPQPPTPAGELSYLDLANNSLSGPLPRYLPRLALSYLDASHNALSGPVAPLLRGAWSLTVLKLDGNVLSGTLPDMVAAKHLQVWVGLSVWEGGNEEGRGGEEGC